MKNTAKNPITGDPIKTKTTGSKNYYDNYDAIFRKSKVEQDENKTNTIIDTTNSNK